MKSIMDKMMQDLAFNRLMFNLGIEPAPLFDIDVVDAEIVTNEETSFKLWFFNMGGNLNFTDEQITIGYQNHLNKQNER